jgi:hypothetical protein
VKRYQWQEFQAKTDQDAATGVNVLVNVIEFSIPHVAHQADIFYHFEVQSRDDGTMKILHAKMLTVSKPVANLDFVGSSM